MSASTPVLVGAIIIGAYLFLFLIAKVFKGISVSV